jgi:hypothetical protein
MEVRLYFFLLSNYWNIKYLIDQFKKLSDYGISDQGLNLSDYRISDSEKTIDCPPLNYGLAAVDVQQKTAAHTLNNLVTVTLPRIVLMDLAKGSHSFQ